MSTSSPVHPRYNSVSTDYYNIFQTYNDKEEIIVNFQLADRASNPVFTHLGNSFGSFLSRSPEEEMHFQEFMMCTRLELAYPS